LKKNEPKNMELTIMKFQDQLKEQHKRKKFLEGERGEAYSLDTHKKNVTELKRICKEHNINEDVLVFNSKNRPKQTNAQLMNQFT
jgi:hypothetical protein